MTAMRGLAILAAVFVLAPGVALASSWQSAPAGLSPSGNASATTIKANVAGALARASAADALDGVNVRDFGAVGGGVSGYLALVMTAGDAVLTLSNAVNARVGEMVLGTSNGIAPGTTVSSVTSSDGNTLVGLSTSTIAVGSTTSWAAQSRYDFAVQDDLPAFTAAQNAMAALGGGTVKVTGNGAGPEFYVSNYVGDVKGVRWVFQNANFTPGGGVAENIDQSAGVKPIVQGMATRLIGNENENGNWLACDNEPPATGTPNSYEHDCNHVQLNQGAASQYAYTGAPSTLIYDLVGYGLQGQCPSTNRGCSLFGGDMLMTSQPGSNGPSIGWELEMVNNRGTDNLETGAYNNLSALTLIGAGTNKMASAETIFGSAWMTGVQIDDTITGFPWAYRHEAARAADGLAEGGHQTYSFLDHAGNIYAAGLHIVAGPAQADAPQAGGVTIQPNVSGQIDIGNSTTSAGPVPAVRFHLPGGSATDAYDLALADHGRALWVQDGAGNAIAAMSVAGGISASQFSATSTAGILASFGGTRTAGQLAFQLTRAGFDIIREFGSQAIYIQTTGGYNAQFNNDGSTTFNGFADKTSQDAISAAGTTQATATALTKQANRITACAPGAGLVVPVPPATGSSRDVAVLNRSGAACRVYPNSGAAIEADAVNASVLVASGADISFRSMSPTNWYQ